MSSSSILNVSGIVGTPLTDTTASIVFGSSDVPYIDVQTSTSLSGTTLLDATTRQLEYSFLTGINSSETVNFSGLTPNTLTKIYSTASGGLTNPTSLYSIKTITRQEFLDKSPILMDDGTYTAFSLNNKLKSANSTFWNETEWVSTGKGNLNDDINFTTSADGIHWNDMSCPFL
jgi:hypothetical protein